jgi:hypothetical protein
MERPLPRCAPSPSRPPPASSATPSVSTTLNVYTHLFDHAEHAKTVIERLEGWFGEALQPAAPEVPADREVIKIGR